MSKPRGILGLSEYERDAGYINYCVSFVFAMTANVLLAFAVFRRSTCLLKSYRKVFVFHIVIDVGLSTTLFLTMCQPVGTRVEGLTIYLHIVDGIISNPPQPWTTIAASILVFLNTYNITTACVSFIYRYSFICHNYEIKLLPFLVLVALAGVLPACSGIMTMVYELESQSLEEKVGRLFANTDWVDGEGRPPAFGIMVLPSLSFMALITPITVLVSYSIVIYCAARITAKMAAFRALQHLKLRYRQHRQLHILLFFQGIIPFFTSALSPCAIHIGRILGYPQPWWYFYVNLLTAWSPVVNPIVALIVIAPYRKFISQLFCPKVTIASSNLPYIGSAKRKRKSKLYIICAENTD